MHENVCIHLEDLPLRIYRIICAVDDPSFDRGCRWYAKRILSMVCVLKKIVEPRIFDHCEGLVGSHNPVHQHPLPLVMVEAFLHSA
jgi:hypothetical protein